MDLDVTCPRCKTSRYRNPSLKLLVNICGHSLCEACVDLIFGGRASGHCPECHVPLKRSLYHLQVFQDSSVEREVEIRKRLSKEVFNKARSDFLTLKDYNDYLEFVEDIVFQLLDSNKNKSGDSMVETAKKKIEIYKKENKDLIIKNKGKVSEDQLEIRELVEEEKVLHTQSQPTNNDHGPSQLTTGFGSQTRVSGDEPTGANKKLRTGSNFITSNESLLYQLATSDLPADVIVQTHKLNEGRLAEEGSTNVTTEVIIEAGRTDGSTGDALKNRIQSSAVSGVGYKPTTLFHFQGQDTGNINMSGRLIPEDCYEGKAGGEEDEEDRMSPYDYTPFQQYNFGPQCPDMDNLEPLGFLYNVRSTNPTEKAGGYSEKYACGRALQEAYSGLYFSPPITY